jgi:hypothetical protein
VRADTYGARSLVTDFYPMKVGQVFEPFFGALGYGKFTIQPSPFCGYEFVCACACARMMAC